MLQNTKNKTKISRIKLKFYLISIIAIKRKNKNLLRSQPSKTLTLNYLLKSNELVYICIYYYGFMEL